MKTKFTCPLCTKPMHSDLKQRMKHFIKKHPERVEKVLGCILENPFRFGMELAEFVVKQPALVHRTLRGIQ